MELGLNFDDEDLVEEQKKKPVLISYNAKICKSKWFLEELPADREEDMATVHKFQADYLYSAGEYAEAIVSFHQCLECLGIGNRTMRREVVESLARCYLHAGDAAKAREYSDRMFADCLTSAHLCQALQLQRQIHSHLGHIQDEIHVLHQLIQLHSFHHPFWHMLSQAYTKLYLDTQTPPKPTNRDSIPLCRGIQHDKKMYELNSEAEKIKLEDVKNVVTGIEDTEKHHSDTSSSNFVENYHSEGGKTVDLNINTCKSVAKECEQSGKKTEGKDSTKQDRSDICDVVSKYPLNHIRLTCLVRIRLILQSSLRNTGSFVKERNMKTLGKINHEIQDLKPDDHVLEAVTEYMRKDMSDDDFGEASSKEEAEIQSDATTQAVTEEFHKRWFSWIKQL